MCLGSKSSAFLILLFLGVATTHSFASPIRGGGSVSSAYRVSKAEASGAETSNWINTINLGASSYIWRPWFMVLNGTGTHSWAKSDSTNRSEQTNTFSTGSARLGVFPTSRFPFEAHYSLSDTLSEIDQFDDHYRTENYGFNQQYHNANNDMQVHATFDDTQREKNGVEDNHIQNGVFNVSKRLEDNQLDLNASGSRTENELEEIEGESYTVTAAQSYTRDRAFTVENMITRNVFSEDYRQDSIDFKSKQFTSTSSWRSDEENTMQVNSSFRAEHVGEKYDILGNQRDGERRTLNLLTSFLKQETDELSYNGSFNANRNESEDNIGESNNFSIGESLGLSYHPEAIDWGVYQYSKNIGASVANQTSNTGSSQQASLSANQGLDREFPLEGDRNLQMNLIQSFATTMPTDGESSNSLVHTMNLGWNPQTESGFSTARFSLSDSREIGETTEFQIANFQVTRIDTIDRESAWSGDLTIQGTRSRVDDETAKSLVVSGSMRYEKKSLFAVPRLDFSTNLTFSSDKITESANPKSGEEEIEWKTNTRYRLGLLLAEFDTVMVSTNGKVDKAAQIKVTRAF